jgi:hypothetical protein
MPQMMCDSDRVRGVVLLIVLVGCGRVGFAPRGDAGECPLSYTRLGTSCYRYSGLQDAPIWLDAELACEADGIGSHLVTIDDAAEATLLATAFETNDFWIGVTDRVDEGVYRNVTGELAPYLVWRVGEPTSSDCAQLDDIAEFHVSSCDSTDEYVCEYDGRPAAPGAY